MSGASNSQSNPSTAPVQAQPGSSMAPASGPAPAQRFARRIRLPTLREAFEPIPGLVVRPATGDQLRRHSFTLEVQIDFSLAEHIIALVTPLLPIAREVYRRQEEAAAELARLERKERLRRWRRIGFQLNHRLRRQPGDREGLLAWFALRHGTSAVSPAGHYPATIEQLDALMRLCARQAKRRLRRRMMSRRERLRTRALPLRAAGLRYLAIADQLGVTLAELRAAMAKGRPRRPEPKSGEGDHER